MMRSIAEATVYEALAMHLDIEEDEIDDAKRLDEDLGLDPLDLVMIALRLEDLEPGFGEFQLAELGGAKTVGDLVFVVRSWGVRDTYEEEAAPCSSDVFA